MDLSDKNILVTGACGGIGLAIVQSFLKQGAYVIATDVNQSDAINQLLKQHDQQLIFIAADISDDDQLNKLIDYADKANINVLVNNAAVFTMAPLLESSITQYQQIFNINVRALFILMQGIAKQMVTKKQSGSIINLSSQAGRRGESLVAHYCASKAAVISYTQSAALALASYNIRVNAIAPGVIDTPMWQTVDQLFAKYENLAVGKKKQLVGEAVPLGRMGFPEEVADVVLFLSSDLSRYITGQTINVDGGNVLN